MTTTEPTTNKRYKSGSPTARGFATLSAEERKRIASIGGKRGHELGRSHKWKPGEEASNAGRKGGTKSRRRGPNKDYKPT